MPAYRFNLTEWPKLQQELKAHKLVHHLDLSYLDDGQHLLVHTLIGTLRANPGPYGSTRTLLAHGLWGRWLSRGVRGVAKMELLEAQIRHAMPGIALPVGTYKYWHRAEQLRLRALRQAENGGASNPKAVAEALAFFQEKLDCFLADREEASFDEEAHARAQEFLSNAHQALAEGEPTPAFEGW